MGTLGLAAGTSLALAIILAPLARILARRCGAVSRPRPDRLSPRATPLLGGGVILIAAFLPIIGFQGAGDDLWGLLGGGVVIFLVGLVDDLRGLSPAWKVVGQALAACTLIAIEAALGHYEWDPVTIPILLLWIVAMTNAFNLLDNMDGLAGGVAAITAGVIFLYAAHGDLPVALGAATVGAAALGFIIFNLPPARIFLGDSGSLLLGLVLAHLAAKAGGGAGLSGWIVPVLLLGVPIFDSLFVIAGRRRAGEPVTRGGKDHLSHRLLDFGLPPRKTLLLLYLLSAGMGGVILLLGRTYPLPLFVVGAVLGGGLLGVGGFLARPAPGIGPRRGGPGSLVVLDLVAFSVAFLGAYLVRFDWRIPEQYLEVVTQSIPLFLGVKFLVFAGLGLYGGEGVSGRSGTLRLLYASTLGSLLAVFIAVMAWRFEDYSRAVFVIDGMITFLLAWGVRYGSSLVGEALARVAGKDLRIAVVGTGEALALLAADLKAAHGVKGQLVGAIRAPSGGPGAGGLDDLGPLSRLLEIAEEHQIRMIWLVGFGMGEEEMDQARSACERGGLILREVTLRTR